MHERWRSGRYTAPPVERVWLDKEEGRKRPIGKPTVEDKLVQRAVAMRWGAIYEPDFQDCSYGFRAGRSPHHALTELREQCVGKHINWIIDADLSGFFDSIDHGRLRAVLRQRIRDGSILRLIGKWLKAGVSEDGDLTYPEAGSPQGGVSSPVLSNIFLHHVLDEWLVRDVQPRRKGRGFLIRFAAAFVIGCELEEDARRIMAVLPKRLARFRLTIHPQKTRLIACGTPARRKTADTGNDTVELLGFTHYWAQSRLGTWVLKRRTARKRVRRAQKTLWQWCRHNRHRPLKEHYQQLCQKLHGHYQYYSIRGNYRALESVFAYVGKAWRYWLSRRRRTSYIPWDKFERILEVLPLPRPRIIPKQHAAYLSDMDEETGRHLWTVTRRTAATIRESGVKCEGINLFLADGEAAFQEVFHVHIYVFPRYNGDPPFRLVADWGIRPPREELDQVARQIKGAYERLWTDKPVQGT